MSDTDNDKLRVTLVENDPRIRIRELAIELRVYFKTFFNHINKLFEKLNHRNRHYFLHNLIIRNCIFRISTVVTNLSSENVQNSLIVNELYSISTTQTTWKFDSFVCSLELR